ncbi:transcription factor IIB [Strigomonas culicis]|uniref:Transcription factor IIB n=1 Tax=Strigomonas culicis TaxID=28005 RepID=S9TY01_9TRYP|nr:transcription factor IIB [Strigomonas culicis]|eukprot:EPY23397.1 transcription factor IIB [Strigomonas culicis]
MSNSVNDFVGRNCPLCGAVDSLDTDEARGEVACTECACVVAMGLAESEQNRFVGDATFEDVDRKNATFESDGGQGAVAGSAAVTRSKAVALAAGARREERAPQASGGSSKYAKTNLHPKMRDIMDVLCESIKSGDVVRYKAYELARHFVGQRRERGHRVDQLEETAAACFQLAAEMHRRPVPLAELRQMAPSLKDVESRRKEVVREVGLGEVDRQLRQDFAPNLIRFYIRMLHAQMAKYEAACIALAEAVKGAASTSDSRELATLSEVDRCVAAVLLARTSTQVTWEGKPRYDPSQEPPLATAYDSFAASANLNATHVRRVMATVTGQLRLITPLFEKAMARAAKGGAAEEAVEKTLKREREQ